jgi:hypothetical protein
MLVLLLAVFSFTKAILPFAQTSVFRLSLALVVVMRAGIRRVSAFIPVRRMAAEIHRKHVACRDMVSALHLAMCSFKVSYSFWASRNFAATVTQYIKRLHAICRLAS